MPQQVRFYSHAFLGVEGQREILLTDPWLFGDVFNDSWTLHAPPALDTIDFRRVRHIWLSHEHPDHMHFPSLRVIRERRGRSSHRVLSSAEESRDPPRPQPVGL